MFADGSYCLKKLGLNLLISAKLLLFCWASPCPDSIEKWSKGKQSRIIKGKELGNLKELQVWRI